MQNPIVWLLEHPLYLGRLTILSTAIPIIFIRIPRLELPMLFAGVMLFATINWTKIAQYYDRMVNSHIWLKIQYFWFAVATLVVGSLVFSTLTQLIDPFFFISALFLMIYIIWFNSINTLLTERGEELILKGKTTTEVRNIDFENYLLPLSIAILFIFLIISLQSLILSRAQSIFVMDTLHWLFPLVFMLLHYIIDALFREQIIWQPEGGITTYKPLKTVPKLPNPRNPEDLTRYFTIAKTLPEPPEGIFEILEQDMEFLVNNAQKISYLPFQIQLVHAMGNWGKHSRSYLHILLMITLASVSRYRMIGLIPLYKRRMFYSALQIIPMSGSLTHRWRELFQYEVLEKQDRFHVLDWIVGAPYLDRYHKQRWIRTWNGTIFKGKEGYYEALRTMEMTRQIPPDLTIWQRDIWELSLEFASLFIGEHSRRILTSEVGLYNQLIYLAQGHTTQEYQQILVQRKEELEHPKNRYVYSEPSHVGIDLSEEEKAEIVRSYLSVDKVEVKTPGIGSMVYNKISDMVSRLRTVKLEHILQMTGLILIFSLNLGIIFLIDRYLWANAAAFVIIVQVALMFILAITPSNADLKLDDDRTVVADTIRRGTLTFSSININTASSRRGYAYLMYSFALLFAIQFFTT